MKCLSAATVEEAMDLAIQEGEAVRVHSSDEPIRCNNCQSYQQIGLEACLGCCRR